MNFNNFLVESTILYESIKQYNTLTEAAEEAFIPPSWAAEFTKFEKGKGEFSKTLVKDTVQITSPVSFYRVIRDALTDPVQGLIVMNKDVPLFAVIKNPKDTSKVLLMAIDPNPAKKLKRPTWNIYTAHDAEYYKAHGKYSEKTILESKLKDALEELVTSFVSNFVKGTNTILDLHDSLTELSISFKTIEIETDNEKADSSTNSSNQNNGPRTEHSNKAIAILSKDYLEKYIKDTVKLINDEVPNIDKAETHVEKAIDGNFEKIKVDDITNRLKKINTVIDKFGREYKNKKNDPAVTSDPDWEKKFADDYITALNASAAA